ncbi:MAG: hypothetical protein QOI36_5938 [Pseudonocardiales bacterium]|nr:hypothetical protein [Pseudonocardiales bacterium]
MLIVVTMSRGTVEFRYRRGTRRIVLTFIALAGLLVFTPQAWAQPVQSATTVQASPASATTGQQVALTATVTCRGFIPGGLGVTFFDGPNLLDTVPVDASGQATLTTSFTTEGTHTITAAYNGYNNCGASNSTTTVQVTAAPTPPTPPTPCGCGSGLVNIHQSGNDGGRAASWY